MLKIYGFDFSGPANMVRMCANAIGTDYQYVRLDPFKGEHKSDEHLARHPAGKVPAIDDDGVTLFESVAIMKYLCRKAGSDLYPDDLARQAVIDQWCGFASIHIFMAMGRLTFNKLIAPRIGADVDERSLADGERFLGQFLPIIEQRLATSRYLAGDAFSIADICLLATIDPAEMVELDLTPYPKLNAWREDLRVQPFYRRVHNFYGESAAAAS